MGDDANDERNVFLVRGGGGNGDGDAECCC